MPPFFFFQLGTYKITRGGERHVMTSSFPPTPLCLSFAQESSRYFLFLRQTHCQHWHQRLLQRHYHADDNGRNTTGGPRTLGDSIFLFFWENVTHTDPVVLTWEWAPGNVRSMKLLWGGPFYMASFRVLLSIFFDFFWKFSDSVSIFFSKTNQLSFRFFRIFFLHFSPFFRKKSIFFFRFWAKKRTFFILGWKRTFFSFLGLKRQKKKNSQKR